MPRRSTVAARRRTVIHPSPNAALHHYRGLNSAYGLSVAVLALGLLALLNLDQFREGLEVLGAPGGGLAANDVGEAGDVDAEAPMVWSSALRMRSG
jgi:hypothetical protein